MSQQSFLQDSSTSWPTWPRWGFLQDGAVYAHPMSERTTGATGGGYWQTPVADDAVERTNGKINSRGEPKLSAQVKMLPTPRSCSAMFARITPQSAHAPGRFRNLETIVGRSLWPTPCSTMSKGSSPNALTRRDGQDRSNDRLDHAVMASDGGSLNPTWVEWLMGFPLGFTASRHWVTPRSRSRRPQPSACSPDTDAGSDV